MSNLRIIGLAIGIFGILVSFVYFRGRRWNRRGFLLNLTISLGLLSVSINPDLFNILRDTLLLKGHQTGRILALIILSNLLIWIAFLWLSNRTDFLKMENERLLQALAIREEENRSLLDLQTSPVMVLIPAYNEAHNLRTLLPGIPKEIAGMEVGVLVVDDGSTDGTAETVREMGHICVRNLFNRGQGAAHRVGYEILRRREITVGVTMDADNQHDPVDLEALVRPVLEDGLDLVIGSRVLGRSESGSFVRGAGIRIYSKLISLVIGVRLTDCTSGYRAFSRKWIETVRLKEDQYQSTEVIIETAKNNLKIGERPVTIKPRRHGQTKKGGDLSYGVNVALAILKAWWRK